MANTEQQDSPDQAPDVHYLEAELREQIASQPEVFSFIERGSLDGLWYWDLEHPEHEWMNDRFWTTFGVDPATKPHLAEAWQELIHPDDGALALENFERHCADSNHPYDQTVRYRHADGSTVWVRCRGLVIRDDTGRPIRMIGAHNDVTAEREALAEVEDRLEMERQRDALAEFVHVAAHDLRSPLNTVAGHLSYLSDNYADELPEQGQTLLDFSIEAANRMMMLLDSLQPFGRSLEGLDVVQVDLDELVDEVWDDLTSEAGPANARLDAAELGSVHADAERLRLVIQNLLSNAIKFRGSDAPAITVTHTSTRRRDTISVADNGRGVDVETAKHAFDLFFRSAASVGVEGSGAGLALCDRIIRMHGGTIGIAPGDEGGAVVTIELPRPS